MSNTAAEAALQRQIERIRSLKSLPKDLAPRAAEALHDELAKQIALGQGPDGERWPLTADGRQPLQGALRALTVRAIGSTVLARLTGPTAMHHLGIAAGRIRRRILPTRKLPARMVAALQRVAGELFVEKMGR